MPDLHHAGSLSDRICSLKSTEAAKQLSSCRLRTAFQIPETIAVTIAHASPLLSLFRL